MGKLCYILFSFLNLESFLFFCRMWFSYLGKCAQRLCFWPPHLSHNCIQPNIPEIGVGIIFFCKHNHMMKFSMFCKILKKTKMLHYKIAKMILPCSGAQKCKSCCHLQSKEATQHKLHNQGSKSFLLIKTSKYQEKLDQI